MKKNYIFTLLMTLCLTATSFGQDLVITGIFDGPLPGGLPKVLELYVVNDIADLSIYGIERAGNGGASSGSQSYTFPADSKSTGDHIYLSTETPLFNQYFGVNPTYEVTSGEVNSNGDDVVLLYLNGAVSDAFGELGVDGSGEDWDSVDGWAYRNSTSGPNSTFTTSEWTFSGANAVDGCDLSDDTGTNAGCESLYPLGTYSVATDPEGQYSDLFFSMYAEGSSNNKFVEIYNGTGSDVDLSNYMIKGSNNGGDWKAERELTLSSTVIDGDVYVISTDQADASILAVGDLALSYESALHYNGDDAIGLFKKDSNGDFNLIDIIGVPTVDPGSGWDVAGVANATSNHTLTRKNSISGPNVDWANSAGTDVSDSEWVVTDVDTEWENLGSYTPAGTASVRTNIIQGFATYPNPITNNKFTVLTSSNLEKSVTLFNLLGKKVLSSSFSGVKSDVDVSTISSGIYILKVTEAGKTATKKLVIR
jgi:hypothetical protein